MFIVLTLKISYPQFRPFIKWISKSIWSRAIWLDFKRTRFCYCCATVVCPNSCRTHTTSVFRQPWPRLRALHLPVFINSNFEFTFFYVLADITFIPKPWRSHLRRSLLLFLMRKNSCSMWTWTSPTRSIIWIRTIWILSALRVSNGIHRKREVYRFQTTKQKRCGDHLNQICRLGIWTGCWFDIFYVLCCF